MSKNGFERAVDAAGGVSSLAAALDTKAQVITNWRSRGVPPHACKAIERLTGVSVKDLRPDDWMLYWPEDQDASSRQAA